MRLTCLFLFCVMFASCQPYPPVRSPYGAALRADRREDIYDRREDVRDRREDFVDRRTYSGPGDRLEDVYDRREDRYDRREDVRDRRWGTR